MGKLKSRKVVKTKAKEKKIPLVTPEDVLIAIAFFICLLVAGVAAVVSTFILSSVPDTLPPALLVFPFAFIGFMICIKSKKYAFIFALLAVAIIMVALNINVIWILALCYITIGVIGVAAVVTVVQRILFYRVLCSVEYLNVKDRLSLWDRVVGFMFNISVDIDTRNLTMDYNLRRASIPWREMWSTMKLAFMIGMFIWIYICMNPSFMSFESYSTVPITLFSAMLYIPLLVMPFSIFLSLNVRIETKYRDFLLYKGIGETLKRMALPVFAAFVFILGAVTRNGFSDVMYFIFLSLFFNLFINGVTCIVYYKYFESKVIDDIVSKWKLFRPVEMMIEISSDKHNDLSDIPEIPTRDKSELV